MKDKPQSPMLLCCQIPNTHIHIPGIFYWICDPTPYSGVYNAYFLTKHYLTILSAGLFVLRATRSPQEPDAVRADFQNDLRSSFGRVRTHGPSGGNSVNYPIGDDRIADPNGHRRKKPSPSHRNRLCRSHRHSCRVSPIVRYGSKGIEWVGCSNF